MATVEELVKALEHINVHAGNPNAWREGLSFPDQRAISEWRDSHGGEVPDTLIGALRNQHPDLFSKTGALVFPPPTGSNPTPPTGQNEPAPGEQPPGEQPPPGQQPAGQQPGGQTPAADDEGFSGKAAEAAQAVDDALAKNKTAIGEADEELVDAVLGAKTGSEQGKAQLQALQDQLIDQIHKLAPSLDTPAGQQQLTEFLESKAQEIRGIADSSGMDAESKAEVLDALAGHYDAVKNSSTDGATTPGSTTTNENGQSGTGTTGSTPGSDPGTGGGGDPALTDDPMLNGLASDPLMNGLAPLAGPALGALSGLPGALSSMMPGGGGGGLPVGDLGSLVGGAIRDATARPPGEDPTGALTEDPTKPGEDAKPTSSTTDEPPGGEDGKTTEASQGAQNNGADAAQNGGEQAQPVAAEAGQVDPQAQPAPDVSVKLPDGSTVKADSPQLAQLGRLHLEGASLEDAAGQAQVTLLPAGAPVSEPVSPGQLRFGDYAQFTDHRVMALGGGKLWSGGQIIPVDEMPTGTNFLGWARPQVQPEQAATVPAAAN